MQQDYVHRSRVMSRKDRFQVAAVITVGLASAAGFGLALGMFLQDWL